ncbi:hypothetical protein HJFPF1_02648 [Paramyrothecium foliicola]|nr:hypothetical protein HJFPF1_02648 [Paramyrothecium foliicola]
MSLSDIRWKYDFEEEEEEHEVFTALLREKPRELSRAAVGFQVNSLECMAMVIRRIYTAEVQAMARPRPRAETNEDYQRATKPIQDLKILCYSEALVVEKLLSILNEGAIVDDFHKK